MKHAGLWAMSVPIALGSFAVTALTGAEVGVSTVAGAGVFGLLVVSVLALYLRQQVTVPLGEICRVVDAMRRDGDLSRRVTAAGGDMKCLATSFNGLVESFQGIVGKVIFDARRVAAAADELSEHARLVADGSDRQHTVASEMARSIDEMNAGVTSITNRAQRTAQNAENAQALSVDGVAVVGEASTKIERIAESVAQSALTIGALGQRSSEIKVSSRSSARLRTRPTCWHSTPPSRRPGRVSKAGVLRWSRTKCASSPSELRGRPVKSAP